jgi:hypothetical protein
MDYKNYDIFEQFDRMKTEMMLVRQNQEAYKKIQDQHSRYFAVMMKKYNITFEEGIAAEDKTLC